MLYFDYSETGIDKAWKFEKSIPQILNKNKEKLERIQDSARIIISKN